MGSLIFFFDFGVPQVLAVNCLEGLVGLKPYFAGCVALTPYLDGKVGLKPQLDGSVGLKG